MGNDVDIKKYENIIKELKDKLNKAIKIIDIQNLEIQDLKNKLNSSKIIDLNQINNLKKEISIKNNQLEQLKQQLRDINLNQNNNPNALFANKSVTFISTDQSICYSVPCSGNSTFSEVEEKLYIEYPELRETNNTFLTNGKEILRFKTVDENEVGTGKPVMLIKPT